MSVTVTIRLEAELKQRLERLAQAMQRSKSFLAAQAIRDFLELNEWQVQEIEQAIVETGTGDFASEDLVRKVFGKWGVSAG